jgi:hypothetical protein
MWKQLARKIQGFVKRFLALPTSADGSKGQLKKGRK